MSDTLFYLDITFEKAGQLRGESTVAGFKHQIEIDGWKWGMSVQEVRAEVSQRDGSGVKFETLDLSGYFDTATINLLKALRHRDKFTKARLSMIHAVQPKDRPRELLTIEARNGYVEDLQLDINSGKVAQIKCSLKLSYALIGVDYYPTTKRRDEHSGRLTFSAEARGRSDR
ncbi:type VI secretion system tube protein Hcp [Ideonella sp. 4Y16]|uniref:Type VI secretion system tube protein Hcp n=1 Tax=Ideonella alba TaxID=2824118 RepID=A0A941BEV2_9BURK|nr:type VI secretion system tube protein Hcp [Ideonella alba]MBQ0930377.1 type VI secretion system tube protein Hcp [Ideonella alba]MBQ0946268.1 type VI secretion system tube protein Hcp [Ideonella alba]